MKIPKPVMKGLRIAGLAGLCLCALAVSYFRILDNYELEFLDARYQMRPHRKGVPDVVLIEIGDDTLQKIGSWPVDRGFHAQLIHALTKAGARSIIFDMFFPEPGASDAVLEKAIADSGRVYLSYVLNMTHNTKGSVRRAIGYTALSIPRLASASFGNGNIATIPDVDGKFRRVPLLAEYENKKHLFVAFLAACDYLGISEKEIEYIPGKRVLAGKDLKIPLDEQSNMMINYSAPWGKAFKHYSYIDILQSYFADETAQAPLLDLGVFKGKICIVGDTATGTTDMRATPLERIYPGVGIHAEVINSILTKRFVSRLSRFGNLAILFGLCAFVIFTTLKQKPFKGLLILLGVVGLFLILSIAVFLFFGLWIDVFYPLLLLVTLYLIFTFRKYIVEWQQRQLLERELDIARTIQESFLPKALPQSEGLEVTARMTAHHHVGGDLYDGIDLGDGKIGIMLGDVSGKGVPAALFMAKVTSEFRLLLAGEKRPSKLLTKLNRQLCEESSSSLFVTLCYLIIDTKEGTINLASGGHMPPVLVKAADGSIHLLEVKEGMPLSLMEGDYSESVTKFDPGDALILYTDGVTEAMDMNNNMYPEERFYDVVKKNSSLSAKELMDAILEDVHDFEGKAGAHDDTTVMVIKRKIPPAGEDKPKEEGTKETGKG
ncbi:MAG: CHASE2 domain-containing protein [Candidatus Omnitrophota bacterium]